ncbi:multiple epidermal growth factor-like domains protein 10 [Periplaneta americana]|uniref:multiple epidermal growth factor-like domains protein 10 n=1 Tax=Periplaneta americana TaxID=6978 RepID=UPI0037E80711
MSVQCVVYVMAVISGHCVLSWQGIGRDCENDADCSNIENSFCNPSMYDMCDCKGGYVVDVTYTKCLKGLGSTCSGESDCKAISQATCVSGICACPANFVAGSFDNKCLRKVEHGGVCEESIQCYYSKRTRCLNGRCVCKTGYNYTGQKCVGTSGLGEPCTDDVDCIVPGDPNQDTVRCFNYQCDCKRGYKRSGDRCGIGGDCRNNADCSDIENSFCMPSWYYSCRCKAGFVADVTYTKCLKVIGGECLTDEDCSSVANSFCDTQSQNRYSCKCREDHVAVANSTKCLKVIGGACSTYTDCSHIENSFCDATSSICKCTGGYIAVENNAKYFPGYYFCITVAEFIRTILKNFL